MLATLPMYDFPELRWATDAFWEAVAFELRKRGLPAPDHLRRDLTEREAWTHPDLVLSQTCGRPLTTWLRPWVVPIAAPCYARDTATYHSVIIARRDARPLATAAVNSFDSHSGWSALCETVDVPATIVVTGSHAASVRAVKNHQADVAAIDHVSWLHLERLRPAKCEGLRIIAESDRAPSLPFIVSVSSSVAHRELTFEALDAAIRSARAACAALSLTHVRPVTSDTYATVRERAVRAPSR